LRELSQTDYDLDRLAKTDANSNTLISLSTMDDIGFTFAGAHFLAEPSVATRIELLPLEKEELQKRFNLGEATA
jgi:hypothetical protein